MARDLAVKFRSVQKDRPSSKYKKNGGIQDTIKSHKNDRNLLDTYIDEGSKVSLKLSLGSPKKPPKELSSGFCDRRMKLQTAGSKHAKSSSPPVRARAFPPLAKGQEKSLQVAKGLVYRRRVWDIPEDEMGCLIAVRDFSPMVGLACPRSFEVCCACMSER
ncbi:hypothetical protein Taro_001234 [Colocasia esculenta]|uniref:Uncharacterized protein n=1 Tax=Colocasia esculenta TaxID=4460 RepID=A0A843T9D1_COLES|nr:hypothetical protein [Colocasia esculenta]